jgi:hypothetical protein
MCPRKALEVRGLDPSGWLWQRWIVTEKMLVCNIIILGNVPGVNQEEKL